MAKIFIILIITLCTGCFGKQHSSKHNNVSNINESDIQLDSLPLTKYEYKMRGNLKDDIGDKLGAIEDYARAIKIDTSYDTAYYNRGLMKSAIGDREGELADYNKTLSINPKYLKAYFNRGLLKYEMGDYEGEIADYRLAIKYCKPDADIYNNLGRALYDLERFKESAEAYGEGIKYFPEDYRLYYGRGLARKRLGDRKGACEDWVKSSELGCTQANILFPLCDEYIKEENDSLKKEKESANKIE